MPDKILPIRRLKNEIRRGERKISIHGIGFVGTSIATVWLRVKAHILAVDRNPVVIQAIDDGKSPTGEPSSDEAFSNGIIEKRLITTTNGTWATKNSRIMIVSVPVGVNKEGADLSNLESAINDIALGLKKGDAVVVTPTLPPTTSKNLIGILEEKSNLIVERDFYYIYSPERIAVGQAVVDIEENYPAIVSGAGSKSLAFAKDLYSIIASKGIIAMSSTTAAESEKLFEGVYRDVNIALANEFGRLCEKLDVDFWEIRNASNSQPYSHIHATGIGVGGFCIPVYPKMLIESGKRVGVSTDLTITSRKINRSMPKNSVNRSIEELKRRKRNISGSKVAVLGLSFRGDIPDRRLSPTYDVIRELKKYNLKISVHDPFFNSDDQLGIDILLSKNLRKVIKGADLIIIATGHSIYKKLNERSVRKMTGKAPILFDGRGILSSKSFPKLRFLKVGTS